MCFTHRLAVCALYSDVFLMSNSVEGKTSKKNNVFIINMVNNLFFDFSLSQRQRILAKNEYLLSLPPLQISFRSDSLKL